MQSSSFLLNSSVFLRKSPVPRKRKHFLRRPLGTFLMYVHMLLCTFTPTSRHVAPPLDLGGVVGHVLDPLPFLYFLGLVSKKPENIFFCRGLPSVEVPRVSSCLLFSSLIQVAEWLQFFPGGGGGGE